MIVTNIDLKQKVNNIYNHLYANSLHSTPQGISFEVGKILHAGLFLEELDKTKPAFSFSISDIKSLLLKEEDYLKFSESLKKSFLAMNKKWSYYEPEEFIKLNDFDLTYTCLQLNNIQLSDPKKDVIGDIIETIRSQWAKEIGGQFFTNSLITRLSMYMLEFDPRKGDDLVDICAGTGGFLLAGLNHIKELLEYDNGKKNIEKEIISLARKSLFGQEIDPNVCNYANLTLNSRIGKSEIPFVNNGNSLEPNIFNDRKSYGIKKDKHLCVATNPPFGTKITIKDNNILRHFDLARLSNKADSAISQNPISHRAPDILFIEQNVKLLKPGEGRLSIVVPYQILSGPQTKYIREWLLKNTVILSVIDLPAETFQPHTGTKTSLLTLKRRPFPLKNLNDMEDYTVFMAIPKWIGHDRRGNTTFIKNPDGSQTNDILTDIPHVRKAYESYCHGNNPQEEHEHSFTLQSSMFNESNEYRMNAQYYKPSNFINADYYNNEKWNFIKVKDATEKIFYPGRFKRDYIEKYDGAIPFLGGADILQFSNMSGKWLSPSNPHIEELAVRKDWIIITRSGSTGIVSIVPEAWDGFTMSEHVIRIVPKGDVLSPLYLLAFLRSNYCQEILTKGVFGSVIDEINPEFIGNIIIPVPKSIDILNSIIIPVQKSEAERNKALTNLEIAETEFNILLKN